MAFKQENKKTGFTKISIGLASPDEIMQISSGEVLKPETINYRTYKPRKRLTIVPTNLNAMVCSVSASSVLPRITSATAVNTNVSVIKVSSASVAA